MVVFCFDVASSSSFKLLFVFHAEGSAEMGPGVKTHHVNQESKNEIK